LIVLAHNVNWIKETFHKRQVKKKKKKMMMMMRWREILHELSKKKKKENMDVNKSISSCENVPY